MHTPKETEEEKADRLYDELLQANVLELMKTGAGKKVIWHILGLCGIYASSFSNQGIFCNDFDGIIFANKIPDRIIGKKFRTPHFNIASASSDNNILVIDKILSFLPALTVIC